MDKITKSNNIDNILTKIVENTKNTNNKDDSSNNSNVEEMDFDDVPASRTSNDLVTNIAANITKINEKFVEHFSGQVHYKNGKQYIGLDSLIYKAGKLTSEDVEKLTCFDYSDTTRLSRPLKDILSAAEIDKINKDISDAVEYAGVGTGKGVAAAAVTLIMDLKHRGIVLPYYFGGGHHGYDMCTFVNPDWGTTVIKNAAGTEFREKQSFDCSAFICWAMCTAGINEPCRLAQDYYDEKYEITFDEANAGDLLVKIIPMHEHVILVIDSYCDNDGQRHLICAESNGEDAAEANYEIGEYREVDPDYEGGIIINDYIESDISEYHIIDMDSHYETHKKN